MKTPERTQQLKDVVAEIEDRYISYDPNQGNLEQSKNTLKRRVGRALEKRSLALGKAYKKGKADPYVAAIVIYEDIRPYLRNRFFKRAGVSEKSGSLQDRLIEEKNEASSSQHEEADHASYSPPQQLATLGFSPTGLYGETFDTDGNLEPIKSVAPLSATDTSASRVFALDTEIRKMFNVLEHQITTKTDNSCNSIEHSLQDLPQMRADIEMIKFVLLRLLELNGETFDHDQYNADIHRLQDLSDKSQGSATNLTEDEFLEHEKLSRQISETRSYFHAIPKQTKPRTAP